MVYQELKSHATQSEDWTEAAVESDLNIAAWFSSSCLLRHYDVPQVCKTCCSLKVCTNRSYYAHSSPPRPFTHKHFPSSTLSFFSLSPSPCPFSVSLISSVLNSANSGQECPDKLVKMTSNSRRRRRAIQWATTKGGMGGRLKRLTERDKKKKNKAEWFICFSRRKFH